MFIDLTLRDFMAVDQ